MSGIEQIIFGALAALTAVLLQNFSKCVIKYIKRKEKKILTDQDNKRIKGRYALYVSCGAIILSIIWNEWIGPLSSKYFLKDNLDKLIHGNSWVTYDPSFFDPTFNPNPHIDSIKQDLEWIKNVGFNGIITFSSRHSLSQIPKIAKANDLKIIMGIYDPADPIEIASAISMREYVNGYCAGHNGLGNIYSFSELSKAINYLRFRTNRFVSTTEFGQRYLGDNALFKIGDWIFPDCHTSARDSVSGDFRSNSTKDSWITIKWANEIAANNKYIRKPILLKMVTYPMDGIIDASLNEQANYFICLLESTRDANRRMNSNVSISYHSAFDLKWKINWPFYPWERYSGLLNKDGTPRPVAIEIIRRTF